MATMQDLVQARKAAEKANRECEHIMRDIAAEANYIIHYAYKDEWRLKKDRKEWHVKFCKDPDEARRFIRNNRDMYRNYYIAKPCVMDTEAFMHGDNLALADYTRD